MNKDELKAFESWLMLQYQRDSSVTFAVLAQVLKLCREKIKTN